MSNTKIVVTLGPSSDAPAVLRQMMACGVSIFRLNASHGSQQEHAARITAVRAVAAEGDRRVASPLDLRGPQIRRRQGEADRCAIPTGGQILITTPALLGTHPGAPLRHATIGPRHPPG